jgi:YidC/Oxa1 family membrane protein insertase
MDRKTLLIVAVCLVCFFGLRIAIDKFFPPKPLPPGSTNSVAATSSVIVTNASGTSTVATVSAPAAGAGEARFVVNTNTAEEFLYLTNENVRYTFTSYGGGVKLVELLHYPETVRRKKDPATGRVAGLNAQAPTPTLAILDGAAWQGDGIFQLSRTATGVRAEKSFANGLTIVKEFQLDSNYLATATVRWENHSKEPLALPEQAWVVGTAAPMHSLDKGAPQTVGLMWYDGQKTANMVGASYFSSSGFMCTPKTPPAEYRQGQSNVVWAAVYNQFFTLVLMPRDPAGQVVARKVDLPRPGLDDLRENPQLVKTPEGYETTLVYPAVTLAPDQVVQKQFTIYAGPKEYQTLARLAAQFNNELDAVMSFGWAGFFSKGLLLAMNWIHNTLRIPYGWVIIVITIIIKILFWPLTQASTRSMKRMQALQPQMKAITEKYKDDPLKGQQKTMEFMKQNKVNPLGSCLPMLLQTPVFIGFFFMIRTAIELRGASFLWVSDLSRPDTLFMIPGLDAPFNLLPLIMGGTMLWQAHLTPPSPGMDPMQQKIMRYLPLMFMAFLYNYSAGLTLYWTVNNLLTILQTKLTRATTDPVSPAKTGPALTPPPKKKK